MFIKEIAASDLVMLQIIIVRWSLNLSYLTCKYKADNSLLTENCTTRMEWIIVQKIKEEKTVTAITIRVLQVFAN